MAVCRVILRGQQIYTVIQTVHSLLYIVAKCNFFSVVTWKDIIKYLQTCEGCTCEGCTHFCEIYVYIVCEDAVGREWIGSREQWTLCQPKHSSYIELASNELVIWIKLGGGLRTTALIYCSGSQPVPGAHHCTGYVSFVWHTYFSNTKELVTWIRCVWLRDMQCWGYRNVVGNHQ